MSLWLEEKYINLVGVNLARFHKQSRNTYNFRCPFCGDSEKQANKARGYFFLYNQKYFFKCHNCNASKSLKGFLRAKYPELYREYQLDVLRDERGVVAETPAPAPVEPVTPAITLPTIASLPPDHEGARYCRGRGLPEKSLSHLYFTNEWTTWIAEMGWSYALPEDHAPRLILPWYNRTKELVGAQARRIDATGSAGRYVTLKYNHDADKIYGWDRLDFHQLVYVVEGPLDSWFLPNAVASMDSDLLRIRDKYVAEYAAVYVWDNEPRNHAVVENLGIAIQQGLSVVIWPKNVPEKDLNDMSQAGWSVETLVRENTFRGLRAELEFRQWKRL